MSRGLRPPEPPARRYALDPCDFSLLAQRKVTKRNGALTPGFCLFGGGPHVGSSTAHRTPRGPSLPPKSQKPKRLTGLKVKTNNQILTKSCLRLF